MLVNVTFNSISFLNTNQIMITLDNSLEDDQEKEIFKNCNYRIDIVKFDKVNSEIPVYFTSIFMQDFNKIIEVKVDSTNKKPGIYGIKRILIFDVDDQSKYIIASISGQVYFEIRMKEELAKTYDEIIELKDKILLKSDKNYISGIGRMLDPSAMKFEFFVFCSDIIADVACRIAKVDIIPNNDLNDDDIINNMKDFSSCYLSTAEFPKSIVKENGRHSSVIHYINVSALSVDEAIEYVEEYTKMVLCAYSIHNMSYGSVVGMVIFDKINRTIEYRVKPNTYKGNLFPSFQMPVSELSEIIIKGLSNPIANYYLNMYLQCSKEKLTQFAYFRFWNLLESIARNKNFDNKYRIDEDGNIMRNNEGKPINMSGKARHLVYELIRRTFERKGNYKDSSNHTLQQKSLEDHTIIWYQRRNCIAHKGGCQYKDILYCNNNDIKKQKCRAAYEESYKKLGVPTDVFDEYLIEFVQISRKVILAELDSYKTDYHLC